MTNQAAIRKLRQNSPAQLPATEPQVSLKNWIGVLGSLLGAFMAVLDIQITNAALKDIQGGLAASQDEGSWISTAYLVAEVVVIPLTGWLSKVFSVRRYLLVNTIIFISASVCCAYAWNLSSMIVFRGVQGFTGGVLIPLSFTIILTKLPKSKQPLGLALFAITATFAPSIGPTIGGWLTDNYGWQYIFYINIFPGLILLGSVWYAIAPQPMQLHLLQQGDWWGILSMAIGLGSLEVVLEEGQRNDWFGSMLITRLSLTAVIFLSLFLWIELKRRQPFINLRLLLRRNFGLGSIANVGLGVGLYGSTYILPLYLSQIQGYSAQQIGEVIMWRGVPQLFLTPLVPKLMQRLDSRFLVAVGFSLFAEGCFMNSTMSHGTGGEQLQMSQIVCALGQPLVMTPLSSIVTSGVEKEQVGSASALFNMMRKLGGSIGIGLLETLLTRREQFHSVRLGAGVTIYSPQVQYRMEQMTQYFMSKGADLVTAHNQTRAYIYESIRREAFVMAFNDCFYIMGMALLLSAVAILFTKKVKTAGGEAGH